MKLIPFKYGLMTSNYQIKLDYDVCKFHFFYQKIWFLYSFEKILKIAGLDKSRDLVMYFLEIILYVIAIIIGRFSFQIEFLLCVCVQVISMRNGTFVMWKSDTSPHELSYEYSPLGSWRTCDTDRYSWISKIGRSKIVINERSILFDLLFICWRQDEFFIKDCAKQLTIFVTLAGASKWKLNFRKY